jgi:hypothetical protein
LTLNGGTAVTLQDFDKMFCGLSVHAGTMSTQVDYPVFIQAPVMRYSVPFTWPWI